jgi:ParB-like chromosome segregation protein Spo0J
MTTGNVEKLSLSRIVARQEVQARAAMNKETIEEYAEAMRKGDKFPPVVVFRDDNGASYWLADGFHRYHAAKQIANKWSLPAEIREGGKREAILFAVGANASHGLQTFTPFSGHTEKLSVYDSKEVCSCQEEDVDEPMTKPSSTKQYA